MVLSLEQLQSAARNTEFSPTLKEPLMDSEEGFFDLVKLYVIQHYQEPIDQIEVTSDLSEKISPALPVGDMSELTENPVFKRVNRVIAWAIAEALKPINKL